MLLLEINTNIENNYDFQDIIKLFTDEELKEEIAELTEERKRAKTMAIKGLITMEEAEEAIVPINKELDKLNFALQKTDKSRELTSKIKENIKKFISNFEQLQITDNITNSDLKKIIKEIRVVKRGEIYVYFNVSDDIDGLNFPINLVGLFEVDSTDAPNEATLIAANSDDISVGLAEMVETTPLETYTNTNHGTQGPAGTAPPHQSAPLLAGPGRAGGEQGPAAYPRGSCHPEKV